MTLPLSILAAAREAPRGAALVTRNAVLDFAAMASRVRALVPRLAEHGVEPGDVAPVAFVAPVDVATIALVLALIEIGVPAMPLHPRWSEAECERALGVGRGTPWQARLVQPATLATSAETLPPEQSTTSLPTALAHTPARHAIDPESILAVIHSSGSSGDARGMMLSRRAFLASAEASAKNLGWLPNDRWLLALPLAHVGGFSILVRCLIARRAVVIGDPATDLGTTRTTLVSLVPTQLGRLLDADVSCPAQLRAVLLGGAASAPALLQEARAHGYPVLASYGTTETCSQIATQAPGAVSSHDVGRPLPGTRLRIADGRLEVQSATLASGFYPNTGLTLTDDGWFALPDRGEFDADGNLSVLGRADDQIVTGGENVAPVEVEAALVAHPSVLAACVFAEPDPDFGQRVCALLVTSSGTAPRDLKSHLGRRLSPFKWPKLLAVCDVLPTLPSGKVDRRAAAAGFHAAGPEAPA